MEQLLYIVRTESSKINKNPQQKSLKAVHFQIDNTTALLCFVKMAEQRT